MTHPQCSHTHSKSELRDRICGKKPWFLYPNLHNTATQALSFLNACCATNSTLQDTQVCILYLTVFDFTRFRCADNCTPQDHFRCVMVCYHTCMPQKTRPGYLDSAVSTYIYAGPTLFKMHGRCNIVTRWTSNGCYVPF